MATTRNGYRRQEQPLRPRRDLCRRRCDGRHRSPQRTIRRPIHTIGSSAVNQRGSTLYEPSTFETRIWAASSTTLCTGVKRTSIGLRPTRSASMTKASCLTPLKSPFSFRAPSRALYHSETAQLVWSSSRISAVRVSQPIHETQSIRPVVQKRTRGRWWWGGRMLLLLLLLFVCQWN